jgi:NADH-quinone oxidoreductase subunit K
MYLFQLITNIAILIAGAYGLMDKKRNVLVVIMCIELLLLSSNLNFSLFSTYLDDMVGQLLSLFILTLAAAESAIGLSILILYYRVRGNINIAVKPLLKK